MGIYGLGVIVAPSWARPSVACSSEPELAVGLLLQGADWASGRDRRPLPATATDARETARKFDWYGFLTLGYGLAALVLVSAKGQKWHWDSYLVMILIVSALLSLALFAVIEHEVDAPLIDLRISGAGRSSTRC
jgi:hypothetical protein